MADFSDHNRALLTAIADLEYETEQRLAGMENLLHEERARADEDVQAQRISHLENDLRTMARLIRRAQVEGMWRTDGLQLQDPQYKDVLQMAPTDMNVKLCIRMPNNECEERMISIPLSSLQIGETGQGKKNATTVLVAQKANHQSNGGGGGQQRRREKDLGNSRAGTSNWSASPNMNQNSKPNSNQRKNLRFQNVNVIRGSDVEEEEDDQRRTYSNHQQQQQQMRRLPQRENLDRPNFFYQQHAVVNGRQPNFGQNRRQAEVPLDQESEENHNWRRSCERLKQENHDLNKVG